MAIAQDTQAGVAAIAELLLSGAVLLLSRKWKGVRSGAVLRPALQLLAKVATVLLCAATLWNVALICFRLARAPHALGSKDELGITAAGFATLWYTDMLLCRQSVRRKRRIAVLLATCPTFRFGRSSTGSPLPADCADSELVIRSASPALHMPARAQDYWRGKVAYSSAVMGSGDDDAIAGGRGVVVLYDYTTQDAAGAYLLSPEFTHAPEFTRQLVADTVLRALNRCRVSELSLWDAECGRECADILKTIRGVGGIRSGELGRTALTGDYAVATGPMEQEEASELLETMWAAITLELLDHYDTGRPAILLEALTQMPLQALDIATWSPINAVKNACEKWRDVRLK